MSTINPPNFPATITNMANAHKSLSPVTFELPFPPEIITEQFSFDYLVFLKANYDRLTGPHNLPHLVPQTLQRSHSWDSLRGYLCGLPSLGRERQWAVTGSRGANAVRGGLQTQSWHRPENAEAQPCWGTACLERTHHTLFTERRIRCAAPSTSVSGFFNLSLAAFSPNGFLRNALFRCPLEKQPGFPQ